MNIEGLLSRLPFRKEEPDPTSMEAGQQMADNLFDRFLDGEITQEQLPGEVGEYQEEVVGTPANRGFRYQTVHRVISGINKGQLVQDSSD